MSTRPQARTGRRQDEETQALTDLDRKALGLSFAAPKDVGDVTSVSEAPLLTPAKGNPVLDQAPGLALDLTKANLPHGARCIRPIGNPPEGGFTAPEALRFATELRQAADLAAKVRQDKGFKD